MKAVIYTRYSAGPDQTVQSIEGQLRICRNYIENNGWEYGGYYADEHISGRTDRRPQFQAMMDAAERHEFNVLVVYSADRFSRNKFHSVSYKQKLKQLGIKIAYAAENIPDGPEGILLESLMEGWAEYYSEELSRKVKRGMDESARKCQATGGRRTFGYRTGPDKKYVVDEEEAEAVRHVFKMVADGDTMANAKRWLNESGYISTLGKPHTLNSVRNLLKNKRYIGYYIWDDVEIPGGLPAIVDPATFYAVQQRFEENRVVMPKNRVKYLLSGKLYCGKCGKPMSGVSGTSMTGKTYAYYTCRSKDIKNIPKEELEDLVAAQTAMFFNSPSEMSQLVDMLYYYLARKNASEVKYRVPKTRISELSRQRDNLVTVIANTGNASLVAKLDEVEAELFRLEKLRDEEEKKKPKTFTREELELSLQVFLDRVDRLDSEAADRRIIDALVKEVIIYEDRLAIIFNIQADPNEPEIQKQLEVPKFSELSHWWSKVKSARTIVEVQGYIGILI